MSPAVTRKDIPLASQNLIRDFVSGFLVLLEDQFVVGDYVTINGASGIVERLTLRMVQIRDSGGALITISHSAATMVQNHSRNWGSQFLSNSVRACFVGKTDRIPEKVPVWGLIRICRHA